jgi:hypothetical protein
MARISIYALSAFAVLAGLFWTPLDAYRVGAWPKLAPAFEVNRALKGDRQAVTPRNVVRTVPVHKAREPVRAPPAPRGLPLGCEPPFSPIAMPAMAHIASRCIG